MTAKEVKHLWYLRHREEILAAQKLRYLEPAYLHKQAVANRKYRRKVRLECLAHYGNKCVCCGETTLEFLSVDHINGGGQKHRKSLGISAGYQFSIWLKRNKWPGGFQILCHNCNQAKGFYGQCPHQRAA